MAPFNPQIAPVNPQEYLKSDSISQPMADQSRGLALKNWAELGDLPAIADKFVKNKATIAAAEGVDAIREIHTASLEAATQPQEVIPQPAATVSGKKVEGPSLMDANASMDVPTPIQSKLDRISTLTAAKEGGKVNDTAYTAQLNSLAKNLRAEYPNYRAYIDETISSMTGFNPANAYAKNLLEDLNQQRAGANKERDHMVNELSKYRGYKTADGTTAQQMIDYVRAGGSLSNAGQWADTVAETEVRLKLKTAAITSRNQDITMRKEKAEGALTDLATGVVNNEFYANAAKGDLMSSQKIAERITEEQMYPGTYTAADMETAGRMLVGRRATMEAKILAEANKPIIDPETGKPAVDENGNRYSWASLNGAAKTQEILNQALKPFDISTKAALDEKTGTATYAATHSKRVREDFDNKVVTDPTNDAMLRLDWLNKNVTPQIANQVYSEALKADVDVKLKNWFADKTANMIAGPAWKIGMQQPTFKKDIEEARNGTTTGGPLPPNSKVPDRIAENINWLVRADIDDGSKMRIAKYYFSPEGRDVLGNFKEGHYDDKGNWVNPREAVWNTLTDKSVTDEITRLSRLPGGGLIAKNYKDWVEQEFAQHLFQPNIKNLNQPPQYAELKSVPKGNSPFDYKNLHIGWINEGENPRFQLLDAKDRPLDIDYTGTGSLKKPRDAQERALLYQYRQSIENLNEGMKNLANMERSLGNKDISGYLLNTLTKAGFAPDATVTGLPEKMAKAIAESSKPNRKMKDALKRESDF